MNSPTIRFRKATKKLYLESLFNDFCYHIIQSKFLIEKARDAYYGQLNKLSQASCRMTCKRLSYLDWTACPPTYQLDDSTYSADLEAEQNFVRNQFNHTLAMYFIWGFEEYESFLKKIYAFIGFMDVGYWQGADLSNTCLKDVKFKDYLEYLNLLRKKRNTYDSSEILKRLRRILPKFQEKEEGATVTSGKPKNYKWTIAYIASIRHCLVHCVACVEDLEKFKEKLQFDQGLPNDKNYEIFINKQNSTYLRQKEEEIYDIFLFDETKKGKTINNQCEISLGDLLDHASLIKLMVQREFF